MLSDILDEVFEDGKVDGLLLTKDPKTGRINCSVFSDGFGPSPLRHGRAGSPSEAIERVLGSIPSQKRKRATQRAHRAGDEDMI